MKIVLKKLIKLLVYSFWFVLITLFFFAPLGFHHNLRFGFIPFLSFLFLDGEGMSPGGYTWGAYQVHFLPIRLVISVGLWTVSLIVVYGWLRYMDSKA